MKNKVIRIIISICMLLLASVIDINIPYLKEGMYIIGYIIIGYDVLVKAVKNAFKGDFFNENLLMSLATIGAICIKEFQEAIVVMILYTIGEIFEELGEEKSKKSIKELMDIKPEFANLKTKNEEIKVVEPQYVNINDVIIVKPGEKVPLDGKVIKGKSSLDTKALTGESIPKEVDVNDVVISGSINLSGVLEIRVTKTFENSTVSKVLQLVENATDKKTKTENFITKFSKIYTPIVILIAIIIFVVGIILNKEAVYSCLYKALTFLVISCPCALVISVPLSFFGGVGKASKKGILIKGSIYIESLANLKTIVFDKTGTLTKGTFEVEEIIANGISKQELIEYASLAEHFSNHPIANSIKKLYTKKVQLDRISDLEEISGKGVKCKIDNQRVMVGSPKFLEEQGIENISTQDANNNEIVYVALGEKYVGKIIVSDKLKSDSVEAINELRKLGLDKIIMLTGDKMDEAEKIGKQLDIEEVHSELLPTDKIKELERIMKHKGKNETVAFVGDGINDSPVLARADVGIAMGELGSDAAIEAADVVIMTDEISKIGEAIKISKKTIKIAKQNIIFALVAKMVVLILSTIGISNMWMAVLADVGVTLLAILNALRTLKD